MTTLWICPLADAECPHGNRCPFNIDQHECHDEVWDHISQGMIYRNPSKAPTGRASSQPNFQNTNPRTEEGDKIRAALTTPSTQSPTVSDAPASTAIPLTVQLIHHPDRIASIHSGVTVSIAHYKNGVLLGYSSQHMHNMSYHVISEDDTYHSAVFVGVAPPAHHNCEDHAFKIGL